MLRGVLWLAGLQALQPPCKAIRGDPHPTSGLASRPSAGKRAEREPGSPARWLWACEPPTNQIPSTSRGPQLGVRRSAARGQGGPGPGRGRGLLGTRALPRSAGPASADPAPPYQVCPCGRLVGDVAARRAPPVPRPLPRPFRRAASRRHGCPRWCRRCRRESALRRVLASGDPTAGRRPGQGAGESRRLLPPLSGPGRRLPQDSPPPALVPSHPSGRGGRGSLSSAPPLPLVPRSRARCTESFGGELPGLSGRRALAEAQAGWVVLAQRGATPAQSWSP